VAVKSKPVRVPVMVRVEPELREAIEHAAEQDRRPLSSMIRVILADWIENRGQQAAASIRASSSASSV
jgi:hypothetical protein